MFVSLPSTAVYTFVSLRQTFRCRFRFAWNFFLHICERYTNTRSKSDFAISFRLICKPSYLPAILMEHLQTDFFPRKPSLNTSRLSFFQESRIINKLHSFIYLISFSNFSVQNCRVKRARYHSRCKFIVIWTCKCSMKTMYVQEVFRGTTV